MDLRKLMIDYDSSAIELPLNFWLLEKIRNALDVVR